MSDPEQRPDRAPELRISDDERHAVAEILREAAGAGRIDLDELDERLEATYAARTYADLVPITADLPVAATAAPTPAAASRVVPSAEGSAPVSHLAIMSGLERKGVWTVPAMMTITCFMGGADLDLREARFAAREVVLNVTAIMGGANIVVGPDVDVIVEGTGIMGGYSAPSDDVPSELTDGSPVLRIRGFAFWGGVSVTRKRRDGGGGLPDAHSLH